MSKNKILIVEDERIVAEDIKRTLRSNGYKALGPISSGEEALIEIEKEKPDLVLMDILLQGKIDGIDAGSRIRSLDNIPIIYITALGDKATVQRAKITEPFGYIHKPVDDKELLSAIEISLYRHKMDKELKESEERYRELVENAAIAILIDDMDGNIVYANAQATALYGYSEKEIIGKPLVSLVHSDDLEMVRGYHRDRVQGKSVKSNYEFRCIRKDGSVRLLEIDVVPNKKGAETRGTIIFNKDITERKQAEKEREVLQEQLVQSEKMAGIGTLASGIAHEFNNLLQIQSGHVQYAKKTMKTKDIKEALDIVLDTSSRAAKIIKDLLTFSKDESETKELCHVSELLESVLSLIEEQFEKQNIKIMRKYEKTSKIRVNKGEIQQVFLNIVTNARDAMLPRGGMLEIGVKQKEENIEVSFRDTGRGIEKVNMKKVFEPFYTTKGAIGGSSELFGTGLGLSVSFGIVKRHEGSIDVKSRVGKGSTFMIKLPLKRASTKGIQSKAKEA